MGEQNAQNDASERGPLAEDSSEQDAKTATEQKTRPNDQEQRGKSKNDVIPQSALADHADNESNDHTETSRDQGDPFRPPKITKVRRRWRTLNNHLMIAFTAIIAGSTLAYAIVAGWQLWTMHGQLNQIQLSSRAWVACYPGSCDKIVVGDKFSFDLVLANSGATPGNKVNVGCAVLIESKDYDIEAYTSARKERAMAQLVRDQTVPPSGRVRVPA